MDYRNILVSFTRIINTIKMADVCLLTSDLCRCFSLGEKLCGVFLLVVTGI